jgi:hypothetical protein
VCSMCSIPSAQARGAAATDRTISRPQREPTGEGHICDSSESTDQKLSGDAHRSRKNVSALSEARFQKNVHVSTVLRRAFDKAVRRKHAELGYLPVSQLRARTISPTLHRIRKKPRVTGTSATDTILFIRREYLFRFSSLAFCVCVLFGAHAICRVLLGSPDTITTR